MPYQDQDAAVALVFADQCTSAARNTLHAARLRKDRRPAMVRLLAAISAAEDIQAQRMLMQMRGKIKDTTTHLFSLRRKKYDDFAEVFPKLAARFGRSGLSKTAEAFEQFGEVAKNHYDRISETAESGENETAKFFLCQVCGYIAAEFPPARCPVCGAIEAKFSEVR
jgi:rubrerythrin